MDSADNLRERLKKVLLKFPCTKAQLARELNTSNECVSSFLTGRRTANIKTLARFEEWISVKEALIPSSHPF